MWQINFLPVRQLKKREQAKGQLAVFLLVFVLVGVMCAVAWLIQTKDINLERNRNAQLSKEKQNLQPKLTLIDKLNKDKEELERKSEVIEQLKKESSLTVRVMDEIASRVDGNRLWLISMAVTGGNVDLKGIALDNESIAQFMDDLKNSPFVRDVSLAESSQKSLAGRDLKSFTIACRVAPPGSGKAAEKPNAASQKTVKP
ncbi:MAG: PilN domain-containing protein [Desulfobulbaceae bacterium]|jgi:type IV pilus assembly protein PilN|nr:PilN domain-containing protein [Desulfobulbaceae bacterium]